MSDAVIITIIGAICSLATVLVTSWNAYRTAKLEKSINGHMTNLLKQTGDASRAEGKAEGKLEERKEVKERKK